MQTNPQKFWPFCDHKRMFGEMAKADSFSYDWANVRCAICNPQAEERDWLVECIRKGNIAESETTLETYQNIANAIRSHIVKEGPKFDISDHIHRGTNSECFVCASRQGVNRMHSAWLKFLGIRKDGEK